MKKFESLIDLVKTFSDEKTCLDYLRSIRWKEQEYCPYCGCTKIYHFSDGVNYKCSECRKRFSIKVGTIFEGSKITLQQWFMSIYLITSHKKGISSIQLSKDIGVTQKTAWFILQRLRYATQLDDFNEPLRNVVEIDETYIGGKEKNKHHNNHTEGTQGRNTKTKTPVLGIVERKGNIKLFKLENVTNQSICMKVHDSVVIGTDIMTDEFKAYRGLKSFYNHQFIQHHSGQYVKGDVHTNTVEGFWSLLKRGIIGIYHSVSVKHLEKYLNEFVFRYNTKDYDEQSRFNYFLANINGRLSYEVLTKHV